MPAGRGIVAALALRFVDELAAGFDPVVSGIAGKGKLVAALGNEVSAEANLFVGRFHGRFGSRCRFLVG